MKLAKIAGFCNSRYSGMPTKIYKAVRLITFLLFGACMEVHATGHAQEKLTLSEKDVPLAKIFEAIEKQSQYHFFYDYLDVKQATAVNVEAKNASLDEVLAICFKGQPLSYYLVGKTVVVKRKVPTAPPSVDAPPTIIPEFKGRVTNESGEPLPGASVEVQNTKKGTMTDEKGMFTLKGIASDAVLEISFTGYQKTAVQLTGANSLGIVMKVATNSLDQVQVIAYGQTTERMNLGDVTTVKGEDIAKQPVNNPLLALEGRVPGLFISQANGLTGTGVTVRVQGQNSLLNGNDPLYVIDGVPYPSQLLSTVNGALGTSGGGYYGSSLSYINPADIESISVLKDADATAIYGSRAANGAILITTKKGKAGHLTVDLNLQQGVGQVAHMLSLMNTQQYLAMRHEALRNDGVSTPVSTDYDINGLWDTTRYTNWQKVLIGGTAQYTTLSADVSGGTANTQYLMGATYHRETTVFPGNFSDQKPSFHFNLNSSSLDQKFHIQLSATYLLDKNQPPITDLTKLSGYLAPDAPALYKPDGSLNWMPNAAGSSSWSNPVATYYSTYTNDVDNLIANVILSYQLMPGLNIRSSLGYNTLQSNETAINPLLAIAPENRSTASSNARYQNSKVNSWIIEPQLNYKTTIAKSKLEALIGTSIQQNSSNSLSLGGSGYSSDLVLQNPSAAGSLIASSNISSIYKYNAVFGRVNYGWDDKYLLDLTARRDGSSRFGSANEFHDFWGTGIGWIFSQEQLIRNGLTWLSFGKIRVSYGTTGNDQIGDYKYLSLYSPVSVGVAYQGTAGLATTGLSNPYLQWEETHKLQFGLDLGFLKDRILVNATYFRNRSSNQLLSYGLPIQTGFSSVPDNLLATVQNSGLEVSLNTVNIKNANFSWTTSFNFTIPQNKLIAFRNLSSSAYASSFFLGKPVVGNYLLYRYAGVNATTGEYQFYDRKGNLTYTPALTDRADTISISPKFYGSIENNFVYKAFAIDVLLQFTKQKGITGFVGNPLPGNFNENEPTYLLDRWQKPGDAAIHQRYGTNLNLYTQFSDVSGSNAGYGDASFVRLTNASVSWQLPKEWMRNIHLQKARLFVQGQNLLTISAYKGYSPEQNLGFTSLPPLRIVTFGIKAGL